MHASWIAFVGAGLLGASLCLGSATDAEEDRSVAEDRHGQPLAYRHGEVELEGWLQRPPGRAEDQRVPGVLICHAWRGRGEFDRKVAERMARLGYVALALDMYGKGVYAKDSAEASRLAGGLYADPALMRARARAGLEELRRLPEVDPGRLAAIGFCFGGATALELARDGADVQGVVSFHGSLKTQHPAESGRVKARVLVCHGGDDPFVPEADVLALWKELKAARVDHQILVLANAVHSFTEPAAGDDPSKGAAYSAVAARRAWDAADRFLAETFDQ